MLASLRLAMGVAIILGVGIFGFLGAPIWVLPILGVALMAALVIGRWDVQTDMQNAGGPWSWTIDQLLSLAALIILVAVIYLIGRGVWAITAMPAAQGSIWPGLLVFSLVAIAFGQIIQWVEGRQPPFRPGLPDDLSIEEAVQARYSAQAPNLEPRRLDPSEFWRGDHPAHAKDTPSLLTEDQIAAEEARLNIGLPPKLRELYLLQNGGGQLDIWAPGNVPIRNWHKGWIKPFSGENDLRPLTQLSTLSDLIDQNFQHREGGKSLPGGDRLLVLSNWYEEALLLDYRDRIWPRVGFVDFEGQDLDGWEANTMWWDTFEDFFDDLRREVS